MKIVPILKGIVLILNLSVARLIDAIKSLVFDRKSSSSDSLDLRLLGNCKIIYNALFISHTFCSWYLLFACAQDGINLLDLIKFIFGRMIVVGFGMVLINVDVFRKVP